MEGALQVQTVDALVDLLDLERIEHDVFRGRQPAELIQRVFGGQVAGQALVAAGRTVPQDRPVHSLHAYFLRPGDPRVPIVYLVDRIRDGRSFTTRRVVAVQHGKAIFHLSASFMVGEPGLEHSEPAPDAPPPESLPTMEELLRPVGGLAHDWWARHSPIEARPCSDPPPVVRARGERGGTSRLWMRAKDPLPDDPMLHACVMTFASDMSLLDAALLPHGMAWDRDVEGASLDHAVWFHAPLRADEWFLYDQTSPSASGARALCTGSIWSRDGRRVASIVQEGLLRLPGGAP